MSLVTCKTCQHEVAHNAKVCPSCGVKNPGVKAKDYLVGLIVLIVIVFLLAQCSSDDATTSQSKSDEYTQSTDAPKWYEGGTLHSANALTWQNATYENKLATSGDIVATLWQKKMLKPSIHDSIKSMDDARVLADALVKELDIAFEPLATEEENARVFTNQTVTESAGLIVMLAGWNK